MRKRAFQFLILIALVAGCASKQRTVPQQTLAPQVSQSLLQETRKPYSQLFVDALKLHYSHSEIQSMTDYLEKSKDYCVSNYKERSRQYDKQLRDASAELYKVGGRIDENDRQDRHCKIQNLRILKATAEIYAAQAIPVAYENREAKLQLIEKWPGEYRAIQQDLKTGNFRERRWANVQDIGYRVVAEGQQDDVKDGMEAIVQLKREGALPPEIDNSEVRNYVTKLAEKITRNSDLQIPVKVTVLNSKEINAFALPGGYLFIQRGLLENAENESQVAGVIAHEIAHDAARHAHKLMRKANIANIFLQAARIAGAVAGGGWYYGLGYGAQGLGLALNLNLLGKSREFELEADQLGIQYSWRAGYDPEGFFGFFDKMASQKGYVKGTSWFRTHPAFYERMVNIRREATFLPQKENYIVQTDDFQRMQTALKNIPAPIELDSMNPRQVSIPTRDEKCTPPPETQQTGVQYLEDVCGVQ